PGGAGAVVAAWTAVAVPTDSSSAAAASMVRFIGPSLWVMRSALPEQEREAGARATDTSAPPELVSGSVTRPDTSSQGWREIRGPGNTDARDPARPGSIG